MAKSLSIALLCLGLTLTWSGASRAQEADFVACEQACTEQERACLDACSEHDDPIECDAACRDDATECVQVCRENT